MEIQRSAGSVKNRIPVIQSKNVEAAAGVHDRRWFPTVRS